MQRIVGSAIAPAAALRAAAKPLQTLALLKNGLRAVFEL
jgi:hypothetical protein